MRVAFLLCIAAIAHAQGGIRGRVLQAESGTPVPGVAVDIPGTRWQVRTDSVGAFVFANVPSGRRVIRARTVGYFPITAAVEVAADQVVNVELRIARDPVALRPIETAARSTEREQFETRAGIGTVTITAAATRALPRVAEADILRTVQLLPGVAARNDFATGFNVRGGESHQNLILLDGYPIYNPFHLGGLFGTFMDATVGEAELLTGAFPARYGGRLSSVLDVRSALETRPGVHTIVDLSALAATARVAGGSATGAGSWSLAARRTYADHAVALFSREVFPYHFRDVHATAAYCWTRTAISVTAYDGLDSWDANFAAYGNDSGRTRASSGRYLFAWGNRVLGGTVERSLGEALRFRQSLSRSAFATVVDQAAARRQHNAIEDLRASGALLLDGTRHDPMLGYDIARIATTWSENSLITSTPIRGRSQRILAGAVFVEDRWQPTAGTIVEAGVRAELLPGSPSIIAPRIGVRQRWGDLALTAGAGRFTQYTHSVGREESPLRLFDIWAASGHGVPVSHAAHWLTGIEWMRGPRSAMVELFRKDFRDLLEANPGEDPLRADDDFFATDGRSVGIDLLLRQHPRSGGRFSGWIAYTLARSERTRGGSWWYPGHDRRHMVNAVGSWQLRGFLVGARFGFGTGTPYTPITAEIARRIYDTSLDRWGTGGGREEYQYVGGTRNAVRMPATQRLDLNVSREFQRGRATMTPYLSVVNAYNARNVFLYTYDFTVDPAMRRGYSQFPLLPSVGVRIAF